MYCLSDKQIDYILNDISSRGIEMECLQQNLLDHVCCIIEQNLKEGDDFESFYSQTIQTFYKNNLWEIEEETKQLLTFKNYYAMKKTMLVSGTMSVLLLTMGLIFKFLHWPGASAGIVFGVGLLSLVFLPLVFVLKFKEKQNTKDKLTILFGSLAAILISLGILFKVMHWPFANILIISSMAVSLLLFLPTYFFSGIRNPETKINTTISSIFIISACGLLLVLVRSPKGSHIRERMLTENYLRNQYLLKRDIKHYAMAYDTLGKDNSANEIINLCENLKSKILENVSSSKNIENDFYDKDAVINDNSDPSVFFGKNLNSDTEKLKVLINNYQIKNKLVSVQNSKSNLITTMFLNIYQFQNISAMSVYDILNQLTQLQLFILHAEDKEV